jgi:hypothetical protein
MKRELQRLGIIVLAATFAIQIANNYTGVCFAAESTRFDDVRQLISAQGNDYKTLRDSLVATGTKWNQELALKEGWEVGLAVAILNARVDHSDAFGKLDSTPISTTRSGRKTFVLEKQVGMEYETFVIEQIWKDLWPEDLSTSLIEPTVMRQSLEGPISDEGQARKLWMALSDSAIKPLLRAISIYALCNYQKGRELVEQALNNGSAPYIVKKAAIIGMFTYKAQFRLDVIIGNTSSIKDNINLIGLAVGYLGGDSNKKSRDLLYQWILRR